jgi:hypothetical protein
MFKIQKDVMAMRKMEKRAHDANSAAGDGYNRIFKKKVFTGITVQPRLATHLEIENLTFRFEGGGGCFELDCHEAARLAKYLSERVL